jgi:hypothetical protein
MVELVKQKCQQLNDDLTIDESASASIMLYTMEWIPKENSFYFILNQILPSEDSNELTPWHLYLKLIHTALFKLPISSRRIFYCEIKLDLINKYFLDKL